MENIIDEYRESLHSLCRKYKVKHLAAFGSVLRQDFHDTSDIDFIVAIDDTDPLSYADTYFALKFAFEQLLGRNIDLLEEKGVKNPILRQRIDETKVLIYGQEHSVVAT